MIHPPETLYLQWDVLGDGADATWSEDMVDDDDIVYVRKERFDALVDVNNDNVARIVLAEHDVTMRGRAIQRMKKRIAELEAENDSMKKERNKFRNLLKEITDGMLTDDLDWLIRARKELE